MRKINPPPFGLIELFQEKIDFRAFLRQTSAQPRGSNPRFSTDQKVQPTLESGILKIDDLIESEMYSSLPDRVSSSYKNLELIENFNLK